MKLYKSKWFTRFARKENISDATLYQAIQAADAGKIDADYGGGVLKQRISRPNAGKSSGYRTIIFYRQGERAFFVYGFAKNERDNIDSSDERDFKKLAKYLLAASEEEILKLVESAHYIEVKSNG